MRPMTAVCKRALLTPLAALGLATMPAVEAQAQIWPERPITIVVPLTAGTGMDIVTRVYADELSKVLDKPVLIENQPGGALMVAAQNVAKAAPDGYTLLVSATLPMTANTALYKRVNYDPERDFVPISLYLTSPFVLIVSPAMGVDNLQAFAARAKASPAPLTYATSGTGGITHLTMELVKRDLGFPGTHVPYRNSGQIVTDVLGGHVVSAMSETGAALALIRDGKLKALGISSAKRHPQFPDVPTIAEAGGKPDFEAVAWHLLSAPAATPRPIVDRLHREMRRITASQEFQKRVIAAGLVPRPPVNIEQMRAYIAAEKAKWSKVVKDLGLEGSQ
jgi:tripartite-type tricarboxylate transporter receptor subunit TctC